MSNFNSLVETWMRAYSVTLPTDNGNAIEHRAKKHALIRLLN